MGFWRRSKPPEPVPVRPKAALPPSNVPPVLLPPTDSGALLARGLDAQVAARIEPDTLWDGSVPGYTAAQAVQTLAALRESTAQLAPLDPASVAPAAHAADVAAGALRAVLVLSGRTTYDDMSDDRSYVAYDGTRRLQLLAEAVAEPRSWSGATSRALWSALVADYAGFEVSTDPAGGLVSLAPLLEDLHDLRPLPGADPAETALRLVEPVLVTAVQRAMRWAVVAALVLLGEAVYPGTIDAGLPRAHGPAVPTLELTLERLRQLDPQLVQRYEQLLQVEADLTAEVAPSKRAGGHMDVRPDADVVEGLLWRAAATVGEVVELGRPRLAGQQEPLVKLAADAYDLLESVSATGAAWPDEGVRALRQATELALRLTA